MSDSLSASPLNSLQFETAEFVDQQAKCSACSAVLDRIFYRLPGEQICPSCAEKVRARQQKPTGSQALRGVLYGSGMAAACSAGYAIITLVTGMELALISLLVGFLIGRAIRKGAGGLGGRKLQIAAVLLTYSAITISYLPLLIRGAMQTRKENASKVMNGAAASASKAVVASPLAPPKDGARAAAVLTIAVLLTFGIALVSPFLMLASGVSGILGLVILFFGLSRAWRETACDRRVLTGPFSIGGQPASG